jgi:hypothetical protein
MRGSKNARGEMLLKRARNSQRARAADGNRRLARLSNAVGVDRVAAIAGVAPSLVRYHERKLTDPAFHAGRLFIIVLCGDLLTHPFISFAVGAVAAQISARSMTKMSPRYVCLYGAISSKTQRKRLESTEQTS